MPRNDGACLWAPAVPFSTVPACTLNTTSFSCHLHTNGFTLERSKSDVQAHKKLQAEYCNKTTFYVNDHVEKHKETKIESQGYTLEKSKTSTVFTTSLNPIDISIFDNRPQFSRAAPSPPVRKKLSPGTRRVELSADLRTFTNQGRVLGQLGIMDTTPVPPKRKISPKPLDNNGDLKNDANSEKPLLEDNVAEDLIKF